MSGPSNPALWEDEDGNTPPLLWEAIDPDERWWFVGDDPTLLGWLTTIVGILAGDPLDLDIEIVEMEDPDFHGTRLVWEVVDRATNGTVFSQTGEWGPSVDGLGNQYFPAVGNYSHSIDTSGWPADLALTFKFRITATTDSYSVVAAVSGPAIAEAPPDPDPDPDPPPSAPITPIVSVGLASTIEELLKD